MSLVVVGQQSRDSQVGEAGILPQGASYLPQGADLPLPEPADCFGCDEGTTHAVGRIPVVEGSVEVSGGQEIWTKEA